MKKVKQILAISGIVLLVGLYLSTLILAITDNSHTQHLFRASVYATVIIPVLIWVYHFIYRLIHKKEDGEAKPKDKPTDPGSTTQIYSKRIK